MQKTSRLCIKTSRLCRKAENLRIMRISCRSQCLRGEGGYWTPLSTQPNHLTFPTRYHVTRILRPDWAMWWGCCSVIGGEGTLSVYNDWKERVVLYLVPCCPLLYLSFSCPCPCPSLVLVLVPAMRNSLMVQQYYRVSRRGYHLAASVLLAVRIQGELL